MLAVGLHSESVGENIFLQLLQFTKCARENRRKFLHRKVEVVGEINSEEHQGRRKHKENVNLFAINMTGNCIRGF